MTNCIPPVNPEIFYIQITAWATVAAVAATICMVIFQILSAKNSTKVELSLKLADKYDDTQMRIHRRALAEVLLANTKNPTSTQMEVVLDLLETVADLSHRGWLDNGIAHNSFSVSTRYWWAALATNVLNMRVDYHDATLYERFEELAKHYNKDHEKRKSPPIGPAAIKIFLESEAN